jgi:hypothetical protein
MHGMVRQLRQATNEFVYFLMRVVHSSKYDPFSIGLTNIINQKNNLSHFQESKLSKTSKYIIELSAIYQWIQ